MRIKVIGGGLAGCEAAYQLLKRGVGVDLYEMRPTVGSPAHITDNLAELVCSNSLKSTSLQTPQGLLKQEMRLLDSLIMRAGEASSVPAGECLAVDRVLFSNKITEILCSFSKFSLFREECDTIEDNSIIATGPLTSTKMSLAIAKLTGKDHLNFYDSISPIISADSINMNKAFWGSRYDKGSPDYLNCPLDKEEYLSFWKELVSADTVVLKDFEKRELFEACMPIEQIAKRGLDTMRFGPMRPVGLHNEKFEKAYAVVQLRKENIKGNAYNIVGFQTNLKFEEQKRVFSMIPALAGAEFERFGVMHRNTYINSPSLLTNYGALKKYNNIFLAGQIIGVEGYMESAASGIVAGINMNRIINSKSPLIFPIDTMIGSLMDYVSKPKDNFQPINAIFGLFSKDGIKYKSKALQKQQLSEKALSATKQFIIENEV